MRRLLLFSVLSMTAFASANAAMGYALEQYDPRAWLVYVVATVAFEAWAIGRRLDFGWPASIGVSIVANFVTAGCCANLCGVGLHGTFVGSTLKPNPIMNMFAMFLVFGLLSGAVEAVVWHLFDRRKGRPARDNRVVLDSIAAHLAWVPLGMAIMLVPARPYPMLEGYTAAARHTYLIAFQKALEESVASGDRVPDYHNADQCLRNVLPFGEPSSPDAWTIAYRPEFGRFSTGEPKERLHWEWNSAASGLRIDSPKANGIWLLRLIRPNGEPYGFEFDLEGRNVEPVTGSSSAGRVVTPGPSGPARKVPPAGVRSQRKG